MDRISRPADSQEPATRHRVDGGSEGVLDGFTRHAAFLLVLLSSIVIGIMAADILHPVVSTQYALGVATGIVTYVLLLRWGVARWLAALATAPLLWDTHRLAGEHGFLADTGSALGAALLLSTGLLMLFWRLPIHPMGAAVAGVALGAATLLQHASAPIVLVALLGTLLAGAPWRERWANALAVLVGWALVILPWVAWSYIVHGELPLDLARRHPGELLTYQDTGPVLSTVLVGGLVLGMLAASGAGRAGPSRMRAISLVLCLAPLAVLLGALSVGEPTDSGLPSQVLLPAAGALGLTALLRGRRGSATDRPQVDAVDDAARADFRERYGEPAFAPVAIVIAAYNEATGLPGVLSTLPSTVCGLTTDIVVVDDGSTDGTAEAVRHHDAAYTVSAPVNRGQGAAMRLGYRVAREHGAQHIITTDADGQYDIADFPAVLRPILDGSADFVTGSRRLGHHHSDDRFRRTGVFVFAWAVNVLTGTRVTDTSFGLRAMRAEVTGSVTLNQPQYQSSELLIGVHSHGYGIVEVPGTMHVRTAGTTKKGGNISYGCRYAGVVLGTWWREGCPSPVTERAPALLAQPDHTRTSHHPR
ncbi:MAG TPA: glycosyltransferase family 2 protein [Jiangellaceae bacterium]|nr:glycosyltransferase family 2 protein [Jiangellaceae bacterium]